jgi:omega-hydroxy-beta-dihydromenaquinone-9 sulfotransferase
MIDGYLEGISHRIFIAGTGRSGTTLLHRLLSSHPSLYGVPRESKFIVEGDGLSELVRHLHRDYSITRSDLALSRFEQLMKVELPGEEDALIGDELYHSCVQQFVDAVTDYEVDGWKLPKMFEQLAELLAISRRLVDRMFGTPAVRQGKAGWVEKTPSNITAMDFLWELFPDATIIHIKRDPRAVLQSLLEQPWAPQEPRHATAFLGSIYLRWEWMKHRCALAGRRYFELKLEDLVRQPIEYLQAICQIAGLPPADFDLAGFDQQLPDQWRSRISDPVRQLCEEQLARYFPLMGYALS